MISHYLTILTICDKNTRINPIMKTYRENFSYFSSQLIVFVMIKVLARSDNVGIALRELGLPTGEETFIGVYSKNRIEVRL